MARDPGWLQPSMKRVLRPLFRRMWKIEITGAEHIPTSGPALIAPNHIAFIDSILMVTLIEREILGVGKAEYMDSWKTRHILPGVGMLPLDRSGGSASQDALDQARASLEAGKLFAVFPEGTRSRDGYLHRGHTGVARLALETGSPIVPVGIRGTDSIQPVDKLIPKLGVRAEIRFGPPITIDQYRNSPVERGQLLRQITDQVMHQIGELSGQTYVDSYQGQGPAD
jgi:1-acyl-sn-glycerol-3-phosphate acyltransferase